MEWKKGVQPEQNISFSSQTSIMPAVHPKNPDTFFSLPWANGPLEYVNKGDNLIKKIQSSSLREQS